MRIPMSFLDCVRHKSLDTLYSMLHCFAALERDLEEDNKALKRYFEEGKVVMMRQCDACGADITRETVSAMLSMVKLAISERERLNNSNLIED